MIKVLQYLYENNHILRITTLGWSDDIEIIITNENRKNVSMIISIDELHNPEFMEQFQDEFINRCEKYFKS